MRASLHFGHLARVVPALVALMLVVPTSPVEAAGPTFFYAGQELLSGTNGIDGYVQGTPITLSDPLLDHVAEWLGVEYPSGHGANWVQAGQFQGVAVNMNSPYAVISYYESNPCSYVNGQPGNYYTQDSLGTPSQPDLAYYIAWDGGSIGMACGWGTATVYEFKVHQGSLNNPAYYGYMQSSWGYPEAELENLAADGQPDPIQPTWFGVNSSHQVQSGYQMSLYTHATNSWTTWTATAQPVCTSDCLTYSSLAHWYAMEAQ